MKALQLVVGIALGFLLWGVMGMVVVSLGLVLGTRLHRFLNEE